jgi:[ribosomal protein S5]-alanine N-acetyltransferase
LPADKPLRGDLVLETERINLRKFRVIDGEFIFRLLNSKEWLKNIGNRNISSRADAENYITGKLIPPYERSGFGFYLIELKKTGESAGMCGLVKREGLDDVDIGFALLPEYEGKGYAFEAATAVLDYAKNKLNMSRLAAVTIAENNGSIKLLEKLGLRFEKKIMLPGDNEELMLFTIDF